MSLPFTPQPGSFLDNAGFSSQSVHLVLSTDGTTIIGKVCRQAKNRFKWSRYDKPVKITTKAKKEPKVAETHHVPRFNTAVWAVTLSHTNATRNDSAN